MRSLPELLKRISIMLFISLVFPVQYLSSQEVQPIDPCIRGGIDCPDEGPIGPIDPDDPKTLGVFTQVRLGSCSSVNTSTEGVYFSSNILLPKDGDIVYSNRELTVAFNGGNDWYRYQVLNEWLYEFEILTTGRIRNFRRCSSIIEDPDDPKTLGVLTQVRLGGCSSLNTATEGVYFPSNTLLPKDGDIVYSNKELTTIFNGGNDWYRYQVLNEWLYEFEILTTGRIRNFRRCSNSGGNPVTSSEIDLAAIESTPGGSFRPFYEKKYVLSGWVKERTSDNSQVQSYTHSAIRLSTISIEGGALSSPVMIGDFYPTGQIIDGWQRIESVFVLQTPSSGELTPNNLIIELINTDGSSKITSYFDDVRIFPFNASIKSFVYDNDTKRLMAELDENNYATYYEYDNEGGLVRVKKETTKGVFTIQETRSSNYKKYKK